MCKLLALAQPQLQSETLLQTRLLLPLPQAQ
jgi:hypothetical protein